MLGTGETASLLGVTTIHDTRILHFHILPFSPIFVPEQRRSSEEDKKWKQWDKTDEIWYEWMKWLFCFKYAKTDSFVDNRKAAGDKTSEHLYPQSSTKTHPPPVLPCPRNVRNVWKPGEKSRKISVLRRSLNPISLQEVTRQLQTVEVTKIFLRKSRVTRHIWKLKLT